MRTVAEAGPTGCRQWAPPTTGGAHCPAVPQTGGQLHGGGASAAARARRNCRLNHNLILIWSVCHPYRRAPTGHPSLCDPQKFAVSRVCRYTQLQYTVAAIGVALLVKVDVYRSVFQHLAQGPQPQAGRTEWPDYPPLICSASCSSPQCKVYGVTH